MAKRNKDIIKLSKKFGDMALNADIGARKGMSAKRQAKQKKK